jgi:hypothetical protein
LRVVRVALAVAMIGAGLGAILLAGAPTATTTPLLPAQSSGIIVVDLSASVETAELSDMYASLMRLAKSKERFGLVLFSDQAYEALPPGTPAIELEQLAYFFHPEVPPTVSKGVATATPSGGVTFNTTVPLYPTNPWTRGFTLGTTISAGLNLAASIIETNHVKPSVWLISDLGDDPPDVPLVTSAAKMYIQDGIRLNVIGLNPTKANARFFASLVSPSGKFIIARPPSRPAATAKSEFPIGLGIAALLLGLLLAVNELWSTPLRWGGHPSRGVVSA